MFYLTTHSKHFIYCYTALDYYVKDHMGYSIRLAARVLCYTSCGALAGTNRIKILGFNLYRFARNYKPATLTIWPRRHPLQRMFSKPMIHVVTRNRTHVSMYVRIYVCLSDYLFTYLPIYIYLTIHPTVRRPSVHPRFIGLLAISIKPFNKLKFYRIKIKLLTETNCQSMFSSLRARLST